MDYVEWLAFAEYDMALPLLDDAEYTRLLESSVNHYRIVLENSTDHKVLRKALFGIVLALHSLGRDDDAKKYAMKEEDEDRRNDLLCWCLSGTEKTIHNQRIAERDLNKFLSHLELASKSIEACEAEEQILKILFPDENYQYYHNVLQYNALYKAFAFCREQNWDKVIEALRQSRFHAEVMVQYQKQSYYRFTAPLFNLVEGEKPVCDSGTSDVDDFISCLNNNHCFDPIREREDFKALLKQ